MQKYLWPLVTLAFIGLAGFFLFTSDSGKEEIVNNNFTGELTDVQETDHKVGSGDKGVTIIEYGDFQCPFCARFYPVVNETKSAYGDDITFVFRHYPIISLHPNAMAAHRAAEAAGTQGKFFEMHDLLYENQGLWSSAPGVGAALDIIEGYATDLELDVVKWKEDAQSEAVFNKITAQQESGNKLGVTGTPIIFVNGEKIDTPGSAEEFGLIIDAAIEGQSLDGIETTGENSEGAVEPEADEATPAEDNPEAE